MKHGMIALSLALLAACSPPPQQAAPEPPVASDAPAGEYTLDDSHADLTFRVNHIGMSMYTARFTDFDVKLHFDPADPAAMNVAATINVASLTLPSPPPGFTEEMLGAQWFDAARYPTMSFRSTAVTQTGANAARVAGDLTLHGITKPAALDVTFNGGYAGHPLDPHGRIGFSARGTLKRSEFGIALGVPAPGSSMGVGDEVEIVIEAEFTGPPLVGTAPPATP
jgi:polyisoprenoid-binding protein YceI